MDETQICNLALDTLKEAPISSLAEERPIARWCNRNFATQRDAALSMANWNFAMKRQSIAVDATAPAFGWKYAYTLPAGCVRLLPLTHDGTDEGSPVAHVVEGGKVLANMAGPLRVRFVNRATNYDAYHPLFVDYLSARLARRMAHWLTGKTSYLQIASALMEQAWNDAWAADAMEGDTPRAADDEWVEARA
jgi:hypothetical protein